MKPAGNERAPSAAAPTHEVFNQSPVFEDVNLFASDAALRDAVVREGAGWAPARHGRG